MGFTLQSRICTVKSLNHSISALHNYYNYLIEQIHQETDTVVKRMNGQLSCRKPYCSGSPECPGHDRGCAPFDFSGLANQCPLPLL
ncbi:MAG: hypothetical protein ACPGF7_14060 [Pontibacterium sp.]